MNAIVSVEQSAHCVCDCECFVGCKRTNDGGGDDEDDIDNGAVNEDDYDDKCAITRIDPMCTSHNRRKRKGRQPTNVLT